MTADLNWQNGHSVLYGIVLGDEGLVKVETFMALAFVFPSNYFIDKIFLFLCLFVCFKEN